MLNKQFSKQTVIVQPCKYLHNCVTIACEHNSTVSHCSRFPVSTCMLSHRKWCRVQLPFFSASVFLLLLFLPFVILFICDYNFFVLGLLLCNLSPSTSPSICVCCSCSISRHVHHRSPVGFWPAPPLFSSSSSSPTPTFLFCSSSHFACVPGSGGLDRVYSPMA